MHSFATLETDMTSQIAILFKCAEEGTMIHHCAMNT